jgi:anti-sigma factor (TIGR02949 family)
VNCQDVETRLGAYLDGELDAAETAAIAAHIRGCPGCAASLDRLRAVRTAVRAELPAYRAPDMLRMRIRDAVRDAAPSVSPPLTPAWSWLAVAAAVALAMVGTWKVASDRAAATLLTEEVLAAHVRSLMPGHLTDVLSSDQHTVKPWFNGRLDFSPPVSDQAAQGFPLVGGRLDYMGERPVAALVYARRLHHVNLFIWPSRKATLSSGASRVERNGYHLYRWTQAGMVFWAVSDLNQSELGDFVRLVQRADSSGAAP